MSLGNNCFQLNRRQVLFEGGGQPISLSGYGKRWLPFGGLVWLSG
jgi:hypothetical protein